MKTKYDPRQPWPFPSGRPLSPTEIARRAREAQRRGLRRTPPAPF